MKKLKTWPNPWQHKTRKNIYDNPWIRLDEDEVINPGGGISHYGQIHFKNLAIGIIPLDEHNNTWLVAVPSRARCVFLGNPHGRRTAGHRSTGIRKTQLKEETGLSANHWEELMRLHPSNSVTDELGIVYVARGLSEGDTEFGETEDLQIVKLPFEEAVARVMSGEITDAISVAGLLKSAQQN